MKNTVLGILLFLFLSILLLPEKSIGAPRVPIVGSRFKIIRDDLYPGISSGTVITIDSQGNYRNGTFWLSPRALIELQDYFDDFVILPTP